MVEIVSFESNMEEDFNYKLEIKEVNSKKGRHHLTWQAIDMDINPSDFTYAQIFMPISEKCKYDRIIKTIDFIYCYKENDIFFQFYRCTMIKIEKDGFKDILKVVATKKIEDGKILEVSKSFEDPEIYPMSENIERMELIEGATLYEPVIDGFFTIKDISNQGSKTDKELDDPQSTQTKIMRWKMRSYEDIMPRYDMPLELAKPTMRIYMKKYFKSIIKVTKEWVKNNSGGWAKVLEGCNEEEKMLMENKK